MSLPLVVSNPGDLWSVQDVVQMTCPMSSGWHNEINNLSHPDELAPGRISSELLMVNAGCHLDDPQCSPVIGMTYRNSNHKSYGWFSPWPYLIQMTYGQCIMSSGWLRCYPKSSRWHNEIWVSNPDDLLELISHPDEIWQIHYVIWMTYTLFWYWRSQSCFFINSTISVLFYHGDY